MPTIHDLPLEIVSQIINSITCEESRRESLIATSLVCRDWTEFAQRALWSNVYLDQWNLDEFLECGAEKFPVEDLALHFYDVGEESTEDVLAAVQGVRELGFSEARIQADWLCGANMKDLKTLYMDDTEVECPIHFIFPFKLTELSLSSHYGDLPTQFLDALCRQSSLESLNIDLKENDSTIPSSITALASQLSHLGVKGGTEGMKELLSKCLRLKHLTTRRSLALLFDHLIAPLESWSVNNFESSDVEELLQVLKSDAVGVGKLRVLRVSEGVQTRTSQSLLDGRRFKGWKAVEEECKKRKIKLILEERE